MFYEKLKMLCDQKGISVTQLTNELGCSQSNVTRWKAGANPRPGIVRAVADYFGVDVSFFYGGTAAQGNNIVQGINHSTVTITNDSSHTRELSEIEAELLRVCEKLDTRKKAELLAKAYSLLEE
ncbi:MAG: helix-turn-helix transcriptional regulator [Clostridia bacterium]|nr:helix-turn-helix transcriptional regulator [Clostridia bacterium]